MWKLTQVGVALVLVGELTDVAQNVINAFSLDGVRELLVDNPGKFSHERVSFVPNFTTRFF